MQKQFKQLSFGNDARNKLAQGVQKLTDAVKVTMGPRGRNVLIQRQGRKPYLTKDGVSVAEQIHLEDTIEDMGAQLVKQVASNTADEAGDGTTTATVLANAIFSEGLRNITAGANPVEVKRGMDKACEVLIENLKTNSKQVTTFLERQQVATISANGDSAIGNMIADAMEKVGADGVITVEESKGFQDELIVVEGMEINSGFLSPYFITDMAKLEANLVNPNILIYDGRITQVKQMLRILEHTQSKKEPLLVICDDIESDALGTLVVNKSRGVLDICVIKSPGYGDIRQAYLQDIAILTGGRVISPNANGDSLQAFKVEDFGKCAKVTVKKDTTLIVDGIGDKTLIKERVDVIKTQLKTEENTYMKMRLTERAGKLSGGIAIIKVGAISETEMKEKKDRVDDALGATKAAQEEGIIQGGGTALIKASFKVQTLKLKDDEKIGAEIVLRAIKAPISQIVENAGYNAGVIINKVKLSKNLGFNAATGEYVDMFNAGIIDSLKVCRVALTNAVSVASMLLTTECIISEVHKD